MIKILELFGGIGACSKALERLGVEFEIADYVEIDKYAVKSFNAIHNTNFEPQDICEWNKDIDVDLIMHGSPCQDFSLAGKQAGGDKDSGTRSSLMYETLRIVNKLKPKYVIWENVKNLLSNKHKHNFDAYIEEMDRWGYKSYYQVLNAKDYGIPQNRERVFTISIRKDIDKEFVFPEKQELKLKLKDMLEDNVDEKYYLSDKNIHYVLDSNDVALNSGRNINNRIVNPEIAKTISCRGAADQRADVTNFVIDGVTQEITVRNLKEQLCDDLIRDGKVKENDMIRHSYTNWRKEKFHTENSRNNNISATLTTRPDTLGIVVKKDTENYIEWEEKGKLDIDCRAYKDDKISGAIVTSNKNKVVTIGNYMPSNHNASRIVDNEGLAPTVMENHGTVTATNVNNLRIRKLIPLETWRLMGFDDEDFYKAEQVNSNAQLYKQAGNSIVVNVLEPILNNLLDEKEEV